VYFSIFLKTKRHLCNYLNTKKIGKAWHVTNTFQAFSLNPSFSLATLTTYQQHPSSKKLQVYEVKLTAINLLRCVSVPRRKHLYQWMEINYMLAYGSGEASSGLLWKFGLLNILLPFQVYVHFAFSF